MQTPTPTKNKDVQEVAEKLENNIVPGPQSLLNPQIESVAVSDSPSTLLNKPEGGVPLATPVDARTLERQRRQKGLKPGDYLPVHCLCIFIVHIV